MYTKSQSAAITFCLVRPSTTQKNVWTQHDYTPTLYTLNCVQTRFIQKLSFKSWSCLHISAYNWTPLRCFSVVKQIIAKLTDQTTSFWDLHKLAVRVTIAHKIINKYETQIQFIRINDEVHNHWDMIPARWFFFRPGSHLQIAECFFFGPAGPGKEKLVCNAYTLSSCLTV